MNKIHLFCIAVAAAIPTVALAQAADQAAQPATLARGPQPLGDRTLWITIDDYPQASIAARHEGTVTVSLTVAALGFVQACTITQSSGFAELDEAACTALRTHAFFSPALDEQGRPIEGSYSRRVRWQLPAEETAPAAATPAPAPAQ